MRTLALIFIVIMLILAAGPLILETGRKLSVKVKEIWRDEEKEDDLPKV